jgi:hypothetical protein
MSIAHPDVLTGASTVAEADPADGAEQYRTSDGPCVACVTSHALDDDRPKRGTVRWEVTRTGRLTTGVAVSFECPNGHSSEDDPALLKAFRRRLF